LDKPMVGDLRFALFPRQVDALDDVVIGDAGAGYADALQAVVTPEVGVDPVEVTGETSRRRRCPQFGHASAKG
jgi:hypothetical protein